MGGTKLNSPVVGMATMPAGDGYYLVAADGGVFNFGSAQFYGSMGGKPLNKPVVGIAVTPDGGGYWLVASDGGIFSYGDAQFYGSMGGKPLNKPIVGIAPTPNGNGYYEVASDGGIFTFPTAGGPPFLGSAGSLTAQQAGRRHGRRLRRRVLHGGQRRRHLQLPEHGALLRLDGFDQAEQARRRTLLSRATATTWARPTAASSPSRPPTGRRSSDQRGGQPINAPVVGISG